MEICDFLKNWKRMCNSMTEMDGCEDCPIVKNTHGARCGDMPCEMQDIKSIVREVEKWAAEHPVVYPTWGEWLAEKGELCKNWKDIRVISSAGSSASGVIGWFYKEIPADIAEKLGIAPLPKAKPRVKEAK